MAVKISYDKFHMIDYDSLDCKFYEHLPRRLSFVKLAKIHNQNIVKSSRDAGRWTPPRDEIGDVCAKPLSPRDGLINSGRSFTDFLHRAFICFTNIFEILNGPF